MRKIAVVIGASGLTLRDTPAGTTSAELKAAFDEHRVASVSEGICPDCGDRLPATGCPVHGSWRTDGTTVWRRGQVANWIR